jgi:endonuclease YncB( thermonuclease family)
MSAILAAAFAANMMISGVPSRVHDGDTLTINKQSIRLFGIDAPELKEPYGFLSRNYLRALTKGVEISCKLTGKTTYKRVVARCFLPSGQEINQLMVEGGMALDCFGYSRGIYRQFEPLSARARLANKGYCK